MYKRPLGALLLVAAIAACADDPPAPAPRFAAMSLQYSGPVSGAISAIGPELDFANIPVTQTGAASTTGRVNDVDMINVFGFSAPDSVFVGVSIPEGSPTTMTAGGPCNTIMCPVVTLSGFDFAAKKRIACAITSGSIQVFSRVNDRLVGSFEGTGVCGYPDVSGSLIPGFAIRHGTFDVPDEPSVQFGQ